MDYEKKYYNALIAVKKLQEANPNDEGIQNWIDDSFPELKESEDEKIRKEIISALKYANHKGVYDKHLAWLEKQGKTTLEAINEVKVDNVDKVEPKFYEGDWITNGDYTWKVISVNYLDYTLQNQRGECIEDTIDYVNEAFYLWTIKDAKDGDVLAFKNNIGGIIICKSPTNYDTRSYCRIINGNLINKEESGWDSTLLVPATKEQRAFLFQTMKEEGYEWDAEKKELKLLITNGSDFIESENCKQKPAWSEEDERIIKRIDSLLYAINESDFEDIHAWLKSLKQRIKGE